MATRKAMQWREVVDDLANALRIAMCYAANARRDAQTLADVSAHLKPRKSRPARHSYDRAAGFHNLHRRALQALGGRETGTLNGRGSRRAPLELDCCRLSGGGGRDEGPERRTSRPSVTASMLRRTEPVVPVVPRFASRVQSKRAAAPTSWTRRFARKVVDAAIVSSRSAGRVIAARRIAHRPAAPRRVTRQSPPRGAAIVAVAKAASIIAITNGPIAPA
jgi:hypothetical protein